jgi:hypothetical protein
MEVSSGKDDVLKPDAPATEQKKSIGDDAEDGGVSSTEPITPDPISSNTLEQTDPSITNQAASSNPSTSRRGHTRPSPIPKRKHALSSVDQVMTQIALPPYHAPHNPLDLVVVEIIFGHIFEAFRHTSQAAGIGTWASDDT